MRSMCNITYPTRTDGNLIEYVCDPLGRRIAKKVNGTIVEKYLWQGMTRLLAVYDGSDNLLMRFEYADDRVPMAMTKAGAVYYLTHDQVGSLKVVVDGAGNIVKRIDYDSFGNVLYDNNSGFAVPLGFAGGLYDRDIKLVRFGFRDYDPDIGRWTAKDPIFFSGRSSDLYGYCLNNPVNLTDLFGLLVDRSDILAIGAEVAITSAKMAGLITAGAAQTLSLSSAILGVLAFPSELYAHEDLLLFLIKAREERKSIEEEIDRMESLLEPMVKKLRIDTRENRATPCF